MAGSKLSDLASELTSIPDAARIYIVHNNTSHFMSGLKLKELLSTWNSLGGDMADNSAITNALGAKIDKVSGATNLAVAILNADGEVVDGLTKLADLLTKNTAQTITHGKTFQAAVLASKGTTGEKTADYTLVLNDRGGRTTVNSLNDITITIPEQSSVGWTDDVEIEVMRLGTGEVTIAGATNVNLFSINSKVKISAQYGAVRLWRKSADNWIISGNLY